MNKYGQTIITAADCMPLYVVEIKHTILRAFSVFSTEDAAREYVESESALRLEYDPDFAFSPGLIDAYRTAGKLFSKIRNKQLYIAY